jgi:hypothetical protein
LNAEQMAIPVLKQKYLALFQEHPDVLTKVISEQLIEMQGCKSDQIEEAILYITQLF